MATPPAWPNFKPTQRSDPVSNPLNIPSTISAADLLAAGLTQAEIAAVGDVVTPAADPAAVAPAEAEAPAPAPRAADMGYDGDEMPGHDGTDGEIVVVDAENELGEGDGTIIREYDPVRDGDPEAATADEPSVEEVLAEPDADMAALLDLRRPEIAVPARDFATEQQAVQQQMKDLQASYDNGDVTQDEFDAQRDTLTDQLVDLRADQRVAAQAVQAAQPEFEAFRNGWFSLVDKHMEANPTLRDDPEVTEGFDAILKQVTSDPKLRTLPAVQQIEIAHRRLGEAYLVARGEELPAMVSLRTAKSPAPAAKVQEAPAPAKPTGPRTDPRPDAPVTLAGISGAQSASLTGDPVVAEVKALMNSGDALAAEKAMARLSPAQLDALSRS